MCSQQTGALVSTYGLKVPNPTASPFVFHPSMTQAAFDFHRAQLYDYNARLHYGMRAYPGSGALAPYHPHAHDPLAHFYQSKYDPRARFVHEEPKPAHSYIGLIAMAILDSKDTKLVLADIYQWILDNYSYFRNRGPGWRNSIRHNLSLNDCFIKSGRSANGKGHYWAIHPANVEDFKKGDFRRRKAQRKVRRHMGLSVPDDEDSPSPPPASSTDSADWATKVLGRGEEGAAAAAAAAAMLARDGGGGGGGDRGLPAPPPGHGPEVVAGRPVSGTRSLDHSPATEGQQQQSHMTATTKSPPQLPLGLPNNYTSNTSTGRKRLFDVESLLAPETNRHSPHGYDLSMHPAKIQKTTLIIKPHPPVLPQLSIEEMDASKRDEEPEEENIDVEETGEVEERGIKEEDQHHHHHHHHHYNRDSPGAVQEISPPERPTSSSPSSRPSPSPPGSRPLTPAGHSGQSPSPRPSPEERSLHYAASPKNSPSAGGEKENVVIRTPGSLALQSPRSWASPVGHSGVVPTWRDGHPSAFHSTGVTATTLTAWNGVPAHAYPLMTAPFPLPNPAAAPATPAEALAAQQRWQETFSRMMASRASSGSSPIDAKPDVKSEA